MFPVESKISTKNVAYVIPGKPTGSLKKFQLIRSSRLDSYSKHEAISKEQREENKKAFEGKEIRQTFRKLGSKKWKQLRT